MVKNRDSIARLGRQLCDLTIAGGGTTVPAMDMAVKLRRLLDGIGDYQKRYNTHEERVLHRHLNLYKNKLEKAQTAQARQHWREKIAEQKRKIDALNDMAEDDLDRRGEQPYTVEDAKLGIERGDLDLDGL